MEGSRVFQCHFLLGLAVIFKGSEDVHISGSFCPCLHLLKHRHQSINLSTLAVEVF